MTRRPRIVHVISGLMTGGAERALLTLLNGGLADRFGSLVISLGDEGTMADPIRETGSAVQALNAGGGGRAVMALPRLRRLVRAFEPDIIQGWMYHGNLAAAAAAWGPGTGALLAWNVRHSLYDLSAEKAFTRAVIRGNRALSTFPAAILYNSGVSREQHEAFGFSAVGGKRIPNGIDLNKFSFSEDARQAVRSELDIPSDCVVVGHVARRHPMKNHALFLRAAKTVLQSHPETRFLMAGKGVDVDSSDLSAWISDDMRDRVYLLGERSDVSRLLSAMDVLCLSSSWGEGFPNVLGEAMSTGVPCVATDVGDSAVVIGNTGKLAPANDENAFATAIESLVELDGRERSALGADARKRIEENFAIGTVVDQYTSFYQKLLAGQPNF